MRKTIPASLALLGTLLLPGGGVLANDPVEAVPPVEVKCGVVYSLVAHKTYGNWIGAVPETMGGPEWNYMLELIYAPFVVLSNNGSTPIVLDAGKPDGIAKVKFLQPQLGLRFQRKDAPGTGFVTDTPIPLDKMYLLLNYPEGKVFTFSLYENLENDTPSDQLILAPGEERILSPHFAAGTSYRQVMEIYSSLTQDIKAVPGWQGPHAGYSTNWLVSGSSSVSPNQEVNRQFRIIPSRASDLWTVEVSRLDDALGCEVFQYRLPVASAWPVAPGNDRKVNTFPFLIEDVQAADMIVPMIETPLPEVAAKPIFSVLVPPASTQLFLTDSDTNGIDDSWEAAFFGTTGIAPEEDADRDGSSNVSEFLSGTSPLDGTDFLRPSLVREETRYHLEWPSLANRTYVVEESPDLGEWTGIATVAGTGETCRHDTGERAQESRFYRLRILPLQ